MKLPKILTEKPPRFWYTVMFCYLFIMPLFIIFSYIVINLVFIDLINRGVTISEVYISFIVNGLGYIGDLIIAFFIYIVLSWLADYGVPGGRRIVRWVRGR
jgi:hypothetical protein